MKNIEVRFEGQKSSTTNADPVELFLWSITFDKLYGGLPLGPDHKKSKLAKSVFSILRHGESNLTK